MKNKFKPLIAFILCGIFSTFLMTAVGKQTAVESKATNADPNFTLTILPSDLDTDSYAPRDWYKIYLKAVNDSDPTYLYPVVLQTNELRTDGWYYNDRVIHCNTNDTWVNCFTDLGNIISVTRTTGAIEGLNYQSDFNVYYGSQTYFDTSEVQEGRSYFILDNRGMSYPENSCYADSIIIKFTLNTVYFDANGGTGECQGQVYGGIGYVKNSTFTKSGSVFKCWNTQADGNGTDYYNGDEIPGSLNNQTLYAKWVPSSWSHSGTIPVAIADGEGGDFFIEKCSDLNIAVCLFGQQDGQRAWTNVRPIGNNRAFVLEYNDVLFEPAAYCIVATEETELFYRFTPEDAADYITIISYWTYYSRYMSETAEFDSRNLITITNFDDGKEITIIVSDTPTYFFMYELYGSSGNPITRLDHVQLDSNQNFFYYTSYTLATNQQFFVTDIRDTEIKYIDYSTENLSEYFDTYYGNILCKHGGTYTFIFDPSTKSLLIKAGFVDEAYQFAIYFNNTVTCTGQGSVNHGNISLAEFWGNIAAEFNTLSNDAKLYLSESSSGEYGNEIQTCLYRYDYIVFYKQYNGCTNFMNRASTYNSSSAKNNLTNNSPQITTVLIALAISELSFAVLVLIKKKRKQH